MQTRLQGNFAFRKITKGENKLCQSFAIMLLQKNTTTHVKSHCEFMSI